MFMVRVYTEDGNRMWLDNGYIWDDIGDWGLGTILKP